MRICKQSPHQARKNISVLGWEKQTKILIKRFIHVITFITK